MESKMLIVAASLVVVQPIASLPIPVKETGRDHVARTVERLAPSGCMVRVRPLPTEEWNLEPVPRTTVGRPSAMRPRTPRVRDRCLPRRDCFRTGEQRGGEGITEGLFRTPTFIGK